MSWQLLKESMVARWTVGFSLFGTAYGLYNVIGTTASGKKYDLEADLTGKTYIVTGATSGIGQVAASELAKRNARVIMTYRNREKCVQIRRDIVLNSKNKKVYCRQCDLEDFDSIRNFVSKLSDGKFALDRIDGVLNNAATMEPERIVNKDGIEKTFATNHLGSFLLTGLLLDKLLSQEDPVRIVFLNTNAIDRNCNINFDDLNSEHLKKFDGYEVYKQSKLANAMFAKELADRLKGTNVSVVVADPGRTKTTLDQKLSYQSFFLSRWLLRVVSIAMGERRVEKAIRPVLYALCDPEFQNANGVFIDRERDEQSWNENVMDPDQRKKIWVTSEKWSHLGRHMKQLSEELGHAAESLEKPVKIASEVPTQTWKFKWLW